MKQYGVLLLIVFIVISSCNKYERAKLIAGDEIVFDLPFEPTLIPIGYCNRGDTQNSFYYFADFRTSRQIACCNHRGNVFKTINLKSLIDDYDLWYTMQVRSLDSFAAISSDQNELFLFNGDGVLIQHQKIPYTKYKNGYYDIYNGPQPPDQGWDHCYTGIGFIRAPFIDTATGNVDWDAWYAVANPGPALAKITGLFSGNPKVSLQLEGIQSRGLQKGQAMPSYYTYANSDANLYYTNCYSDTLYRFDDQGNLTGSVPLKSSYSNIGALPISIAADGDIAQAHSDTVRDLKGVIREGKYDKYRKLIYLMFYHEVPVDAKPINKGEHRAWSMFIYNEQLEKLAEIPFKADTYLPKSLIVNPAGILLKKIDRDVAGQGYKQVFQQFKVTHS